MDCCKYADYRAMYGSGAYRHHMPSATYAHAAYPPAPSPLPYAAYGDWYATAAPQECAPCDPYARYAPYHYDYRPPQLTHDHAMYPMDYQYGGKEGRARRTARELPRRPRAQHHASIMQAGIERVPAYPPHAEMAPWTQYQMGDVGMCDTSVPWGGYGAGAGRGGYGAGAGREGGRPAFEHDPLRGMAAMRDDCASVHGKGSSLSLLDHITTPEPRPSSVAPSYMSYESSEFSNPSSCMMQRSPKCYSATTPQMCVTPDNFRNNDFHENFHRNIRANSLGCNGLPNTDHERMEQHKRNDTHYQNVSVKREIKTEIRSERVKRKEYPSVVEEKSSPIEIKEEKVESVPLPAFQQAFGSTEIGRFSEAFTRSEEATDNIITEDMVSEAISSHMISDLFEDLNSSQGSSAGADGAEDERASGREAVMQIDASFAAHLYSRKQISPQPVSPAPRLPYIPKEIKCEDVF